MTDEESGNTEYRITIPVYSRPKPENPSVDPAPEPNIFHETVTAVNNAADRAEKAAKDTEQIRDNLNLDLSEKITRPQSAKVGQVIAVKEVGIDGKPTDFEAKDMIGGASTEEIKEAVGAYMQEHPFEETDPTVPDWAKQPEKPTYTAEDVGALPDNTKIPTKTSELENDSGFLVSPPTPEVGKILKIKSVNEDGTFTCEWADGGSNLDVRINGKSIIQDGVAEIPMALYNKVGIMGYVNEFGVYCDSNHIMRLTSITPEQWRKSNVYNNCAVTLLNFEKYVKAAMCDGKGAAWTADEQKAAKERIGVIKRYDVDLFESVILEEEAASIRFNFPETQKLEYCILRFEIPQVTKSSPLYIELDDALAVLIPSGLVSTSGTRCLTVECFIKDKEVYADISGNSTNFTTGQMSRAYQDNSQIRTEINYINLRMANGCVYPAGTKVSLLI